MTGFSMLSILLYQFNFESRFENWKFLSPSCLVDTTAVQILKPTLSPWEYYCSHKSQHCLFYQITCSLGKPFRFLSFDGPFKGAAADVSIFRSTLLPKLRENERVMCDKGYYQENRCWCPPTGRLQQLSTQNKAERRKVTRIRHLNERLIGRLTTWGCFKKKWRYSWEFQADCAHVVAKLTQLEVYAFPLM